MDGAAKLWLVIGLVGAGNYLVRLSFIALLANAKIPALVRRALRFVAVAMLAALIVPMVLGTAGIAGAASNPRVPAALVAAMVAWFTRSTGWTLAAGMATLWVLQAISA
jgi:branched-subunit amino acid transport protein